MLLRFLAANYICEKNKAAISYEVAWRNTVDHSPVALRASGKWVDVARLYLSLGMPRGLESGERSGREVFLVRLIN